MAASQMPVKMVGQRRSVFSDHVDRSANGV
jgi:hypothetical protein